MSLENGYRYSPLTQSDSIRLAVIQPSSEPVAPIQAALVHTSISECENDIVDHYTALSYVWGAQTDHRIIRVDGRNLAITASLDDALRHIRHPTRALRVWADGVCINQRDTQERNQQVRQMGRVYENATHTIVFLGLGTPGTDFLLDMLKSLKAPQARARNRSFLEQVQHFSKNQFESLTEDILARPWFGRIWVLQELVLSNNPWVQCGTLRIKWDLFCDHMLPRYSKTHLTGEFYQFLRPLLDMDEARSKFRAAAVTRLDFTSGDLLWDLLISRRGCKSLDPRDILYAHLGMTDIHTRNSFVVDYNQTVSQVFEEIAATFIRRHQDLSILMHVGDRSMHIRHEGLPSWVPDWSTALTSAESNLLSHKQMTAPFASLLKPPPAHTESNPCVISLAVPHLLGCLGYSFDSVCTVVSPSTLAQHGSRHEMEKMQSQLTVDLLRVTESSDVSPTKALALTIEALGYEMLRLSTTQAGILSEDEVPHSTTPSMPRGTVMGSVMGTLRHAVGLFYNERNLLALVYLVQNDMLGLILSSEGQTRPSLSGKAETHLFGDVPGSQSSIQQGMIEQISEHLIMCSQAFLDDKSVALLSSGMINIVPAHCREGDHIYAFRGDQNCTLLRPVDIELIDHQSDTTMLSDMIQEMEKKRAENPATFFNLDFSVEIGHYEYISRGPELNPLGNPLHIYMGSIPELPQAVVLH